MTIFWFKSDGTLRMRNRLPGAVSPLFFMSAYYAPCAQPRYRTASPHYRRHDPSRAVLSLMVCAASDDPAFYLRWLGINWSTTLQVICLPTSTGYYLSSFRSPWNAAVATAMRRPTHRIFSVLPMLNIMIEPTGSFTSRLRTDSWRCRL